MMDIPFISEFTNAVAAYGVDCDNNFVISLDDMKKPGYMELIKLYSCEKVFVRDELGKYMRLK